MKYLSIQCNHVYEFQTKNLRYTLIVIEPVYEYTHTHFRLITCLWLYKGNLIWFSVPTRHTMKDCRNLISFKRALSFISRASNYMTYRTLIDFNDFIITINPSVRVETGHVFIGMLWPPYRDRLITHTHFNDKLL